MVIAIHDSKRGFHPRWIDYCNLHKITYKLVDCYANDIIDQVDGCGGLMWHHNHTDSRDILFAKQLLYSLQQSGMKVFPDFNTGWHFDDKVGQKYLLEAIGAPFVSSYVFYTKSQALEWVGRTTFPKVFKLRRGAGSANVQLVNSPGEAVKLVVKAFGRGFRQYDPLSNLKERWRRFGEDKSTFTDLIKGVIRIMYEPAYSHVLGSQRGYIYFQDFIPGNTFDIRIVLIEGKAFGIKRMVRDNDFRASGSGRFLVDKSDIDERCVQISFDVNEIIKSQCIAFDYIFNESNLPLIVEISYGFSPSGYVSCPGYWKKNLEWTEGTFDPYGWMVESLIE